MLFDCVFFVAGLPLNRRLHADDLFMAEFSPDIRGLLVNALTGSNASDAAVHVEFFRRAEKTDIVAVGMRLPADDAKAAMALGRHRLDAFIDAWALTVPRLPKVSQLVVVCPEGKPDGWLQSFSPTFWVEMTDPDNTKGAGQWSDRNDRMFGAILPLFDVATSEHAASSTALAQQLAFSAKMYRHGGESQVFAIEFLCKFAALEGLVCGGERQLKRQKLTQRLPALFRGDAAVNADLNKLWDWRNAAVHQSQGFHSEFATEGKPVQVHVVTLERLFAGTVVFAASMLGKAATVSELWSRVTEYTLPPFAAMSRPSGAMRFPGTNWHAGTGLTLRGARSLFEQCLHSANATVTVHGAPDAG